MLESAALSLALKVLTPILVGFATPFAVDAIKHANKFVDASPPYVKQGLAMAVAAAATALTTILGADVPANLAEWDGEVVNVMVSGFLAIAIKQHKQLKKAATGGK